MNSISTLFFGLSLVSLAGCGAEPARGAWTPQYPVTREYASTFTEYASTSEFAPRSLVLEQARFSVTFPCVPTAAKRAVVGKTPFGFFRSQTYSCKGPALSTFVAMIGLFGDPPPELLDGPALLDQPTDAAVAAAFAVELCNVLIKRDHRISCSPGSPVDMGGVTDVEISFGAGSRREAGRVRVALPYIATLGVVGNFEWDDLQKALDIKLPAPRRFETFRVADQGRKPYNAYASASPNAR
jgi:hypothetical protein